MNYRTLGHSGIKVSRVGFGCMSLGDDQKQNQLLIHEAIELGINFFDTADLYQSGQNEEMLGTILDEKREQVVLATKVGNKWNQDGSWSWNANKQYILQAVQGSLKRLKTDYIDLYQLHGGMISDPIEEIIEAFEILIDRGLIRSYGISSIRPNVIRTYLDRSHITSLMVQYSLLDRRPEEKVFTWLDDHQTGVLARGSLAKGLLVDKPPDEYLDFSKEKVADLIDRFKQLSDNPGKEALHFVLQQPCITSAVIGIRNQKQLRDAIAWESVSANAELLKQVEQLFPVNIYRQHRD